MQIELFSLIPVFVLIILPFFLGQTTTDILSIAVKARSPILGPLSPRFDLNKLVAESLEKGLPPDAHIRCNRRLFISVTRVSDRKNVILSEYSTREELMQVRWKFTLFSNSVADFSKL